MPAEHSMLLRIQAPAWSGRARDPAGCYLGSEGPGPCLFRQARPLKRARLHLTV